MYRVALPVIVYFCASVHARRSVAKGLARVPSPLSSLPHVSPVHVPADPVLPKPLLGGDR